MTLSANATRFLAAATPEALARSLGFVSYDRLRTLIYPRPRYSTFEIRKRDGSSRTIASPALLLKELQRRLATMLLEIYGVARPSVHAFCKDRSVVTNAAPHSKKKTFVFNVDLKDFFHSIHFGRVRGIFRAPPFNFAPNNASILAHICCLEGRLPQGAPTSPVVSNLACRSLDGELQHLARQCRATYTRYADDLTFSFTFRRQDELPKHILEVVGAEAITGTTLTEILRSHSFEINTTKVRLRGRTHRQEVTGLTVNEFPNVRRVFVHEVRGMLHAWSRFGLEKANTELAKKYRRQLASKKSPQLERVVRGKLLYLRMVRGGDDPLYNRLAGRFNELCRRDKPSGLVELPELRIVRKVEDLARAVFVIECVTADGKFMRLGTAFALSDQRLVTCEHVLRTSEKQPIKYFDVKAGDKIELFSWNKTITFEAEIENVFIEEDLAFLKPMTPLPTGVRHLPVRRHLAQQQERVRLVGFPNYTPGKTLTILGAAVGNLYKQFAKQHFEIDQLIRQGQSGGPVVDDDFQLVGIAKEGATQEQGNNAVLAATELISVLSPLPI